MIRLMGKKGALILAILAMGLGVFFIKSSLPPTEDELLLRYLAMSKWERSTPPTSFSNEMPFPIPVALVSLFGKGINLSLELFRVPNLILCVVGTFLLYLVAKRGKTNTIFPMVMLCISPWYLYESLFDLPAILTLVLSLSMYLVEVEMEEKTIKWVYLIFLMGFAALSSFAGPVFGAVFLAWKFLGRSSKNKRWILAGLLCFAWIFGVVRTHWWSNPVWFFKTDDISLATQSELVDQRARYEYRINNYVGAIPLQIKRLVYNKFYFSYRAIAQQTAKVLDIEKWSFPGQSVATVSRSLWASKGLPWLLFWQVAIALWAVRSLSHEEKQAGILFLAWAIIGMVFATERVFLGPGIGIVVPVALWSGKALSNYDFKKYWLISILLIWGVGANLYHFINNEVYWRDTRPKAFMEMARMAKRYKSEYSGIQVTTMIGRSFLYYAFTNGLPPSSLWAAVENGRIGNVYFDHFELKKMNPTHELYIGFPGEFLGSKQIDNSFDSKELPGKYKLLDSYKTHDSLSFGNGDYIWAIKVEK
jgi:hypothetical protein